MSSFAERLATIPGIEDVASIDFFDKEQKLVHTIPNADGKRGSLRLYNYLAILFDGHINKAAAYKGLEFFGELVDDARCHPGKHPNIELLLEIMEADDLYYNVKVNKA